MRALLLATLLALPALAEDTIVVSGHGEAPVRPDLMEIRFRVVAKAEKAADAVVKIGEKSGKVKLALETAAQSRKLTTTGVTTGGLEFKNALDNEEAMVMGNGDAPASEVLVETALSMTVEGIGGLKDEEIADHVSALVDAAVADGGVYSGGVQWDWTGQHQIPASVTFRVKDPTQVRRAAWEAAAADAKARASEIAKLFGREVGAVVKIEDMGTTSAGGSSPVPPSVAGGAGGVLTRTGEASLSADLKVEFRLK